MHEKPMLICHDYPASIGFAVLYTGGLEKCVMTCVRQWGLIRSIFRALNLTCVLLIHPSPHLRPQQPLVSFLSPYVAFAEFIQLES